VNPTDATNATARSIGKDFCADRPAGSPQRQQTLSFFMRIPSQDWQRFISQLNCANGSPSIALAYHLFSFGVPLQRGQYPRRSRTTT